MRILHICSFFAASSANLYKNIFDKLDNKGHQQTIYVPYKSLKKRPNISFRNTNSRIHYCKIFSTITRVAYFYKTLKATNTALSKINVKEHDIIHAHTWYTDGGVAYMLHKKYNTPYVITVRSTDLNIFADLFIHTRNFAKEITLNARQIIFVSKAYKDKFLKLSFVQDIKSQLLDKCIVISNGIDDFWLDNAFKGKKEKSEQIKLIYVGNFLKRKNTNRLIDAVIKIKKSGVDINLSLVGGGRTKDKNIYKKIERNSFIKYYDHIQEREKLMMLYRNNDIFIMPSFNETFGLVYIEALSQGLPVIYTINEGIDGMYSNIGEGVNPNSIDSIASGIISTYNNYDKYDYDVHQIVSNHNWNTITDKLLNCYE